MGCGEWGVQGEDSGAPTSALPEEDRLKVDTKALHNRVMSDIHKGVTSLEHCSVSLTLMHY